MIKKQLSILLSLFGLMFVALLWMSLPTATNAQNIQPTPMVVTPGMVVLTTTPAFNPNVCLTPLRIPVPSDIYIRSGVNIRAEPSESSALMWNTIYDNYDDDGNVVENPVSILAQVVEGPVCRGGFNWWRVTGLGGNGWVAEGSPARGGYYIIVPGLDTSDGCFSVYTLRPNTTADLLVNAVIRVDQDRRSQSIVTVPAGSVVNILAEGNCSDGRKWWRVRASVGGALYEGWMAETEGGNYYLVPTDLPSTADGTLCDFPLNLAVGQQAFVNTRGGDPKSLRTAPGVSSPLLATLVDNVPLIIEGGPICRDNLNWWRVRVRSSQPVVGWMAEGGSGPGVGYWISTINPNEFAR
jgi:hypothetical protein